MRDPKGEGERGLDAGTPAEAFSEAQSTRAIAAAEGFLAAVGGIPSGD